MDVVEKLVGPLLCRGAVPAVQLEAFFHRFAELGDAVVRCKLLLEKNWCAPRVAGRCGCRRWGEGRGA